MIKIIHFKNHPRHKLFYALTVLSLMTLIFHWDEASAQTASSEMEVVSKPWIAADVARYNQILDWVYETMNQQYYAAVSRKILDQFKSDFPAQKIHLLNLNNKKTEDFVHLGAGLLVSKLRDPKDRFSTIIPPTKIEAFKEQAYAEKKDLGIKGRLFPFGFEITHVQKHTQAFNQNLRAGDVITTINDVSILNVPESSIIDLLEPEIGAFTRLSGYKSDSTKFEISIQSEVYFIETVETLPTHRNDILALRITQFNQKTSADFAEALTDFGIQNIRNLILDLRDNQGGPPLAAKEIMGYLSPANDPLFLVVRKNQKPFLLTSDKQAVTYEGPISVLVNPLTSSAAETLTGILREKGRAIVYGQQTNGASYLKSLYAYEDGSSLMLVTSRTFFHNLKVFPADGLAPDVKIPEELDAFEQALSTL